MTLRSYLIAKGILTLLDGKGTKEKVVLLAVNIDKQIDERFGVKSEEIQLALVKKVLFPLCQTLLKEEPKLYYNALQDEYNKVAGTLSKNNPYL